MSDSNQVPREKLTSAGLVNLGRSVKILGVIVIVLLSGAVSVIVYSQLRQSVALAQVLEDPNQLLEGFVLLMLLTVGYLVGKGWSTSRDQRRLIEQLLEEEAIARAQRLDPITDFHHPGVCRDILLRQANYANRLNSPLSLLELTIPNLPRWQHDPDTRPLTDELLRQVRRLCRPIDSLLRWTPDSFLLLFPEVTRQELPGVIGRIRSQLEKWAEMHFSGPAPSFPTRGVTLENWNPRGDILLEVQRLLENGKVAEEPGTMAASSFGRREKSVGLALELRVKGVDQEGLPFQESVVTERVAADRVWFPLKKNVPIQSALTIVLQDRNIQESAMVTRLFERNGQQLIEAQFAKTPENWVVRTE